MQNFMRHSFSIKSIVLACYVAKGSGERVHNNRKSHGLAFMNEDTIAYRFDNGAYIKAPKRSVVYLPKGSSYIVEDMGTGGCYAINFELYDEVSFEPFSAITKNSSDYLNSFSSAERAWRTRATGCELKCKSSLYNILYMLQNEHISIGPARQKYKKLLPAIEYIHKNYISEQLSVAHLASLCEVSPEYFRSIFHECYSTSPLKYINNLKFTRACELIESGMYSIKDVSELSGFSDISYFSRAFKHLYGVSPSEYGEEK